MKPRFNVGDIVTRLRCESNAPFKITRVTFSKDHGQFKYFGHYMRSGRGTIALESDIKPVNYDYRLIKKLIKDKKPTFTRMCKATGLSYETIKSIQLGVLKRANIQDLTPLARFFGLTSSDLIQSKDF